MAANNEFLARHIRQNEVEHQSLERMILTGDAALDQRISGLERRAQG